MKIPYGSMVKSLMKQVKQPEFNTWVSHYKERTNSVKFSVLFPALLYVCCNTYMSVHAYAHTHIQCIIIIIIIIRTIVIAP